MDNEFFFKQIIDDNELCARLRQCIKEDNTIGDMAENLAAYLIRTKNIEKFAESIKKAQIHFKTYNEELSRLYPLLVYMAASKMINDLNSEKNIPEKITRDSLRDINIWTEHYKDMYGKYGLEEIEWLANIYCGNIIKIGDFQYELNIFPHSYYIFKNKKSSESIMIAGAVEVTDTGHITGTNGEDKCIQKTHFSRNGDVFEGCLIDVENAVVTNDYEKISLRDWELTLKPGDPVVNIHMPKGCNLSRESCVDSISNAVDFYERYFSDIDLNAFITYSWLLDINLKKILPKDSNIIRFMKLFKKYPEKGSNQMIYDRVFKFGFDPSDIDSAPENTTLQKNLKKYLKNGGSVYTTGGYILKDSI